MTKTVTHPRTQGYAEQTDPKTAEVWALRVLVDPPSTATAVLAALAFPTLTGEYDFDGRERVVVYFRCSARSSLQAVAHAIARQAYATAQLPSADNGRTPFDVTPAGSREIVRTIWLESASQ